MNKIFNSIISISIILTLGICYFYTISHINKVNTSLTEIKKETKEGFKDIHSILDHLNKK